MLTHNSPFGEYVYVGDPVLVGKFSPKKLDFKCKCGNVKKISVSSIHTGKSKSCGECNKIHLNHNDKFNKLTYVGEDILIHPKSEKKLRFRCECEKEKHIVFYRILNGRIKSCGECNKLVLKTNCTVKTFTYIGEEIEVYKGCDKNINVRCKCGNVLLISVRSFFKRKSCPKCNELTLKKGDKYGNFIYVGNSVTVKPWVKSKLLFECRCGQIKRIPVSGITSGDNVSCGHCYEKIFNWYKKEKSNLKNLEYPIKISDFPEGGMKPIETINYSSKQSKFRCGICDMVYNPTFNDIKRGKSLTCGCVTNKISRPVFEIQAFLKELKVDSKLEFKLDNFYYDLCVPNKKFILEFNGLKWHSKKRAKDRDVIKYNNARTKNYSYLMIYEDEWSFNKEKIKNLLKNKLIERNLKSLRPSKCEIKKIKAREASAFYEKFHYIGARTSSVHYGVYFENELTACASFGPTTRQSKYEHELLRMASDPLYRVHGIWSKILKIFRSEFSGSIVSFSDNRLFEGKVYEKLGFKLDGEVRPDYYWVKGRNRFHKSGLRKTPEERKSGKTETELREEQGFRKIWDLGKKRWVLL